MYRFILTVGIIATLGGYWALTGHSEETPPAKAKEPAKEKRRKPDPKKVKELMELKLKHTQELLAALVVNDIDKAGKNADALLRMPKEEAFRVVNTPDYEMYSDQFTRNTKRIVRAIKDKKADAAKVAYLELTLNCFNCHAYVRDLGDIKFSSNLLD